MTDEKLEKAIDLKDSISTLRNVKLAFNTTYPKILIQDPDRDSYTISFINLDATTREELQNIILDYIEKRILEVKKEYNEL